MNVEKYNLWSEHFLKFFDQNVWNNKLYKILNV